MVMLNREPHGLGVSPNFEKHDPMVYDHVAFKTLKDTVISGGIPLSETPSSAKIFVSCIFQLYSP